MTYPEQSPSAPAGPTGPDTSPMPDGPLIGPVQAPRLHVMTFNLRVDLSQETRPGDPDHWPDRQPIVTDLLAHERPTLLGVQEATFGQLGALAEGLPNHRMLGYGRQGGSRDEHTPIWYDPTRIEVLTWDQLWLSDTPRVIGSTSWGNETTRIVVTARLRDRATGNEFCMINTHLDHASESARVQGAAVLLELINAGRADGLPVLLTGDFNTRAHHGEAYTVLVTDGPMIDTWDTAEQQLTPEWNTCPDYAEPVVGGARIDWVLTTGTLRTHKAAINNHRSTAGGHPSDHLPVQAVIELG
ncbi:MAG: endonuclease/exonuclease/phosphatase family protein [Propionibacteriales bacterium]|nr:endonuclease/exonuclease/phosphatase family protein [Propionibacteriales bacterium]